MEMEVHVRPYIGPQIWCGSWVSMVNRYVGSPR